MNYNEEPCITGKEVWNMISIGALQNPHPPKTERFSLEQKYCFIHSLILKITNIARGL
jgi:hypothetical protein